MPSVLEQIISRERLGTYLTAASFDPDRALALYAWNMKIGAAFLPLLSAAEVSLRNLAVARIISLIGLNWWQVLPQHLPLGSEGIRKLKSAERSVRNHGYPVDSGRMTAELSFGFWDGMLLPKYEPFLWQHLHSSFPDLPDHIDRQTLYVRCGEVRELRNRIFHHEPIFRRNISQDYANCLELIGWLSAPKAVWIKPNCNVMAVLRQKP